MIFERNLCVPANINKAGGTRMTSYDMNLMKVGSVPPRSCTQAEIQVAGQNISDSVSPRNNSETRHFFPKQE